jgi:acyl-CoA thioesterase
MELKLNGTHQLLAYADDVNLLDTIKVNKKTKFYARRRMV